MRTVVVKIGGALVGRHGAEEELWTGLQHLRVSDHVVLVHGGGPQATEVARRLGHTPRIVHGRRVTTDLDLEIVEWTMRGSINTRLVAQAHARGIHAVGLSGVDDGLLRVRRRSPWIVDGEMVDFGWVGDVLDVGSSLLRLLLDAGRMPVLAPLGVDVDGHVYNVNADTVALSVASALQADTLFLVADSGGVRRDRSDPSTRIPVLTASAFEDGLEAGWISDGMRVKLAVAFDALREGVEHVHVLAPDDLVGHVRGTQVVLG